MFKILFLLISKKAAKFAAFFKTFKIVLGLMAGYDLRQAANKVLNEESYEKYNEKGAGHAVLRLLELKKGIEPLTYSLRVNRSAI
jgi:hypothetical protein